MRWFTTSDTTNKSIYKHYTGKRYGIGDNVKGVIIVLGERGIGKSHILELLEYNEVHSTYSRTFDAQLRTMYIDNTLVRVWDCGGCENIRHLFQSYPHDGIVIMLRPSIKKSCMYASKVLSTICNYYLNAPPIALIGLSNHLGESFENVVSLMRETAQLGIRQSIPYYEVLFPQVFGYNRFIQMTEDVQQLHKIIGNKLKLKEMKIPLHNFPHKFK